MNTEHRGRMRHLAARDYAAFEEPRWNNQPPSRHCGIASTASDSAYHRGPSPEFQVAAAPAPPRIVPTTPRMSACLIGSRGASFAVSQAPAMLITRRYDEAISAVVSVSGWPTGG